MQDIDFYDVGGQTVFPIYGASGGLAAAYIFYFVVGMQVWNESPRSGIVHQQFGDSERVLEVVESNQEGAASSAPTNPKPQTKTKGAASLPPLNISNRLDTSAKQFNYRTTARLALDPSRRKRRLLRMTANAGHSLRKKSR